MSCRFGNDKLKKKRGRELLKCEASAATVLVKEDNCVFHGLAIQLWISVSILNKSGMFVIDGM